MNIILRFSDFMLNLKKESLRQLGYVVKNECSLAKTPIMELTFSKISLN